MITSVCQRWVRRCARFVPPAVHFDRRHYEVAEIADDTTPSAFIEEHHYSGSYPNAWQRFGLYTRGALVGCAVFSVPVNLWSLQPFPRNASAELGRFVLLDEVPFDAETFFLKVCADALRRIGLAGFVMFSDPHPRTNAAGETVFPGHVGTIYQAFSAVFLGCQRSEKEFLLPDGTTLARRALSKVRARAEGDTGERSRGWRYVVADLVAAGAPPPNGDLGSWLDLALAQVTRVVKNPGKYKYAFALHPKALSPSLRTKLPKSLPFPKVAAPFECCVAHHLPACSLVRSA